MGCESLYRLWNSHLARKGIIQFAALVLISQVEWAYLPVAGYLRQMDSRAAELSLTERAIAMESAYYYYGAYLTADSEAVAVGVKDAGTQAAKTEVNGKQVTTDAVIAYVKALTEKYNFVFIEDMLDEDDWDGFEKAHKEITRTFIIADDFTVSNPERIRKAYARNSIDGFILKPNQVGTISEALESHRFANEHGLFSITSGRSGGVVGDVVMDLAVGLQIPFIKNGCPRSGERIDKLNFLMRVKDNYPGCHMAKIDDIVKF